MTAFLVCGMMWVTIKVMGGVFVRDTRKNAEYFRGYIAREQGRIEKYEGWIKNGEIATERIPSVKESICMIKQNIWFAKYSLGEPISDLIDLYEEMANGLLEHFEPDVYSEILLVISLGVLLNSEHKTFELISSKVQESGKTDWLCNYLINSRIPEVEYESCKLLWPKDYLGLQQIVQKSTKKAEDMFKYLSKSWYKSNKDAAWYDRHKREKDEKFDYDRSTYYGYWSFESGAVAKILGLDDPILKDTPYYPYDLVHFK